MFNLLALSNKISDNNFNVSAVGQLHMQNLFSPKNFNTQSMCIALVLINRVERVLDDYISFTKTENATSILNYDFTI